MKILADEHIPGVLELFGTQAEIIQKPGHFIQAEDLQDIDILLVRTITRVDRALLEHSSVKYVGTASAGVDHLDCAYLDQTGIQWVSAPGANASAVAEYVLACIAALQEEGLLGQAPSVGIIGMGHVGRAVASALNQIEFKLYLNDPPRAHHETDFHSTPLEALMDCDLVCLHSALTHTGAYPSYHLLNESLLSRLKPSTVLLNAGRGALIDEAALLRLKTPPVLCLDVWEHEPNINLVLLQQAKIATPHIAGYSQSAKRRATEMLYEGLQKILDLPPAKTIQASMHTLRKLDEGWQTQLLQHYHPLQDTAHMKAILLNAPELAEGFEKLRREYRLRKAFL